jgi:hypothetical protein
MVYGILGICIKIEKLSFGKRSMSISIAVWHIVDLGSMSTAFVTRWCQWRSKQRWHWSWCWLFWSVWWRYTNSLRPPWYLQSICCAILARTAAVRAVVTIYSLVSLYCSVHLVMARKPDSRLPLVMGFGMWFMD